jgi:predicted nucleic acid-binding protein
MDEPESFIAGHAIHEFTNNGEGSIAISALTRVEFVSTISKYVRTGRISKLEAKDIFAAFEYQCLHEFVFLPVHAADYERAVHWLRQMTTSLRTMDALHLAVAHANKHILVTADRQLSSAAEAFGVANYFVSYG